VAEGKSRAAARHVRLAKKYERGKRFYMIPYSSWLAADGDDAGELVLYFTGHEITVKGRNLDTLIAGLEGQRVTFIQEFDAHLHEEPGDGEPCIESIEVAVSG
jgi:hypothetical protein